MSNNGNHASGQSYLPFVEQPTTSDTQTMTLNMTGNILQEFPITLPTPRESRSVTVVIPALNEEGNLDLLMSYLSETFNSLGYTLPVLVIDDGSTDSTPEVLKSLNQQYEFLTVIRHPIKRGVTEVWKTALTYVKTDWIFWGQADLETDPRTDIPLLLQACVSGVDGVAGWRQKRGDGKKKASSIANLACRLVFDLHIHDMNWIKLVRRDLVSVLPIEKITHRYLLAVLAAQGYCITDVPTPWHPRYSGKTKFGKGRLFTSSIDFLKLMLWFATQKQHIYRRQEQNLICTQ